MNRQLITEELIKIQSLVLQVETLLRATELSNEEWIKIEGSLNRGRNIAGTIVS